MIIASPFRSHVQLVVFLKHEFWNRDLESLALVGSFDPCFMTTDTHNPICK